MDQKDSVLITQDGPVAVVAFAMASVTDVPVIAMASKSHGIYAPPFSKLVGMKADSFPPKSLLSI